MAGREREVRYHFAGWVLFILCAILFLFSALRVGDGVLALASLIFLLGCVLFLIPLLFPHTEPGEVRREDENNRPKQAE